MSLMAITEMSYVKKCIVSVQHIFTHDGKYKTEVVFCNEA